MRSRANKQNASMLWKLHTLVYNSKFQAARTVTALVINKKATKRNRQHDMHLTFALSPNHISELEIKDEGVLLRFNHNFPF